MDLVLSSKLFTWDKYTRNGLFMGSATILEKEMRRYHSRLQYREGEWGFYMESHRTGRKLWFKRVNEHRSEKGELLWVNFASESPDLQLRVFSD